MGVDAASAYETCPPSLGGLYPAPAPAPVEGEVVSDMRPSLPHSSPPAAETASPRSLPVRDILPPPGMVESLPSAPLPPPQSSPLLKAEGLLLSELSKPPLFPPTSVLASDAATLNGASPAVVPFAAAAAAPFAAATAVAVVVAAVAAVVVAAAAAAAFAATNCSVPPGRTITGSSSTVVCLGLLTVFRSKNGSTMSSLAVKRLSAGAMHLRMNERRLGSTIWSSALGAIWLLTFLKIFAGLAPHSEYGHSCVTSSMMHIPKE
mmetsp:Transcript_29870/g.74758  ORF Transcript_29870/g.74758 Transcript_29870/m.74758 type:complete len:263 (-) Transcript_29870:1279-2067(-)